MSSFKAAAVNPQLHEAYTEILLHQLSTYPTTLNFAPESMSCDLLCCSPTASADTFNSCARHILLLIYPNKNPSAHTRTAPLVSLVQEAKIILLSRHVSQIYNGCGVDGVRRAQQRLWTCMVFNPSVIASTVTVSLWGHILHGGGSITERRRRSRCGEREIDDQRVFSKPF